MSATDEYRLLTREELQAILASATFIRTTSGGFEAVAIHGGGDVTLRYHDYHGTPRLVPEQVYLRVAHTPGTDRAVGLPDGVRELTEEVLGVGWTQTSVVDMFCGKEVDGEWVPYDLNVRTAHWFMELEGDEIAGGEE